MPLAEGSWLCLLAAAAVFSFLEVDLRLLRWAADMDEILVEIAGKLTLAGNSTWYLVPIAVVAPLLWFAGNRAARAGIRSGLHWMAASLAYVFAAIAVSGIVVNLIKFAVGRARPRVYLEDGFFGFNPPGVDYEFQSFPSGHASTCFALVLSIAYFAPRYRMPLLLIGGFLALTRVLVSAHYLSDVLAGGAVAILVTLLLHRYCVERRWVFRRLRNGAFALRPEVRAAIRLLGIRDPEFRQ